MLELSDLDIVIAKESFVIGVPLSEEESQQALNALTGGNPSKEQIAGEIQKAIASRDGA